MGSHVQQLRILAEHPDYKEACKIKDKEGLTALDRAKAVREKKAKAVQVSPCHDETIMILETGKVTRAALLPPASR